MLSKGLKRLSKVEYPETLSYCPGCKEYFIDDVAQIVGAMRCPNKDCAYILERHIDEFTHNNTVS